MRLRGPACNNTIIPERLAFTHWFFATTSATTDDVLDECEPERERGNTPHTYVHMYKERLHVDIVHYRGFWLPYKNYRGFWLPYRNYRGFWLPYRNYRGGQLPCKNYSALPWSLVTVQILPWRPVTVRKLLRITAVNVTAMKNRYRGKPFQISNL